MPDTIKDGTGHGYVAAVNSKKRLLVRATNVEQRLKTALDGDYYEASTGVLTLTDANEFWPLYIENSDTQGRTIIIDRVFVDVWASTGGSDGCKIEYYKNPGYSGGTAISPVNTKFDSLVAAPGVFLKSLSSITGTEWWAGYVATESSNIIDEGRIVINPGRSFGIAIVPPTGNTSMQVNINIGFYYLDVAAVGEDV